MDRCMDEWMNQSTNQLITGLQQSHSDSSFWSYVVALAPARNCCYIAAAAAIVAYMTFIIPRWLLCEQSCVRVV